MGISFDTSPFSSFLNILLLSACHLKQQEFFRRSIVLIDRFNSWMIVSRSLIETRHPNAPLFINFGSNYCYTIHKCTTCFIPSGVVSVCFSKLLARSEVLLAKCKSSLGYFWMYSKFNFCKTCCVY